MDWFVAFMPQTQDNNNENLALAIIKGDRTTKLAISDWTAYLNAKAMLNNAGQKSHIFANKCKPFTNADIFQMFGLYIIDGITPSPQLQQKMQPQSKQLMHGNDKNTSVIGTGSQQVPFLPTFLRMPRSTNDAFKVDEFFCWLCYIQKEVWCLS